MNLPHSIKTTTPAHYLCRCSDIKDGHSHGFDPLENGKDTMFVVRQGMNFFAYRNDCPHYDHAKMAWKKNEFLTDDLSMITCSAHGALFEIETGVCTLGPCIGDKLTQLDIIQVGDEIWLKESFVEDQYA